MYKTNIYRILLSVVIIWLFFGFYWNNGYKSEKAHITEVHMVGKFTSFGRSLLSTCNPKRKVGFLKMHKCASSTLSNIFLRYAYKNDLNIILPLERKNSIGNGKELFSIKMIEDTPWHHLGYDMLAIHTRWNHSAVKNALGGDPVFITIIREPTEQFESMYGYFNFYKILGDVTLPEFIDKLDQIELEYKLKYNWSLAYNRINGVLGKNQMLFNLGFPVINFDNEIEVKQFVEEVNKNFHLVMITERMEESIILLKQVLCWDYKDLVNLKLNNRDERVKVNLSLGQTEKLRKWLKADNYLYNKLRDVFDEKVKKFGHEKMEEEKKKLASTMSNILKKCFPGNRIPAERLLLKELREKTGCRLYGFYDSSFLLNFLDLLKSAQWKRADMDILQSLNLN